MASCGRERDQLIVSLLAYAGLRPQEALALTWADVRPPVLIIDKAVDVDGSIKTTKTNKIRTVPITEPLGQRLAEARGPDDQLIVGKPFHDYDWRNWLRDVWRPACKRVGVVHARPYDLRHTFISKLIAERASVVEVARQAGNSPAVALGTYGHVFDEAA